MIEKQSEELAGWLVGWSLTALSAQKGYIVRCRNYSLLNSFYFI